MCTLALVSYITLLAMMWVLIILSLAFAGTIIKDLFTSKKGY